MVKNTVTWVTRGDGESLPPLVLRVCRYSQPEARAGVRFPELNFSRSARLPAATKAHGGKER